MATYVNLIQAADYLTSEGITCSKQWLKTALAEGHGPAYIKASARKSLFTKADIDAWRKTWVRVPAGTKATV
jgi:hypothetical protein